MWNLSNYIIPVERYRSSILLRFCRLNILLVKHRKLYTHPNPLVSENLRNHSAFTIGRTFLLYFPEANHNERSNKKRKTIGMMIDYNRAIVYDGRMIQRIVCATHRISKCCSNCVLFHTFIGIAFYFLAFLKYDKCNMIECDRNDEFRWVSYDVE